MTRFRETVTLLAGEGMQATLHGSEKKLAAIHAVGVCATTVTHEDDSIIGRVGVIVTLNESLAERSDMTREEVYGVVHSVLYQVSEMLEQQFGADVVDEVVNGATEMVIPENEVTETRIIH